ncbi:MAG TPA: ABC transporter ATP-binding protein [Sumerlaeia bacterium]|nr:ABC transporter ATP-binding protein [Sumerlaeia bacterium]
MPAVELVHVTKIHPLRSVRARSFKHLLLSLFRQRRVREDTITAVDDVCLEVPEGQALGVIGANGAGKTSLLSLIAGITPPTRGEIHTKGRVLPLLELGAGFHPDLSGYENILLQGTLLGFKRSEMSQMLPSIVEFAELEEFIHMPVRHYSSGMYLRLAFSISAHVGPDVLLVDEGFAVGDLYFQQKCLRKMEEFHRRGIALLIVTHDINLAERVCDEVVWIDRGRIIERGAPSRIAQRYKRRMFETAYPEPIPLAHREQAAKTQEGRYGSGLVTFDFLDFRDENGRVSHTFLQGRPMEIRMRYHVHEPVPDMHCMVYMQSDKGHGAACISTLEMNQPIRPYPGGGVVAFRIERLDLGPGRYRTIASICSGDIQDKASLCDLHVRVIGFLVESPPELSKIAATEVPVRWRHLPGNLSKASDAGA